MTNITIYSTPTCVHCRHAKEFFKENNIPYTEHNVIADRSKLTEMVEISGQRGVPVIDVGGDVVVGFDQDWFKEHFKEKLGLAS